MALTLQKHLQLDSDDKNLKKLRISDVTNMVASKSNCILEIYQNPGSFMGKMSDKDSQLEIARIQLSVASELWNPNYYYPVRSDVHPDYQKKGIGYFLYDKMIQYLWDQDKLLISGSLNTASRWLWAKLEKEGRVTDRNPYMGYKYHKEAIPKI